MHIIQNQLIREIQCAVNQELKLRRTCLLVHDMAETSCPEHFRTLLYQRSHHHSKEKRP